MTPNNFFPPEISKLLEELGLGCEYDDDLNPWHFKISSTGKRDVIIVQPFAMFREESIIPGTDIVLLQEPICIAYSISDIILNKQNAILLFGEEIEKTIIHPNPELSSRTRIFGWQYHIHHLLDLYNSDGDWQGYVSNFLKK